MPNQTIEGNYRYAYQGQEKDPETGKEAFELRLWDARIGRWLTVDPYSQYHSPYMGMDNNPISSFDTNGGCTDCGDCPSACKDFGYGVNNQIPEGHYLDIVSGEIFKGTSTTLPIIIYTENPDVNSNLYQSVLLDRFRYNEALRKHEWMQDFHNGRVEFGKGVGAIIGIAIAPLIIIEAAPVIAANATFTTEYAATKAGINLIEQSTTQLISEDGSLGNINFIETGVAAFTPTSGKTITNEVLGSSFSLTINDGFKLNEDAVMDFTFGQGMNGVHSKIDGLFPSDAKGSTIVYKKLLKSTSNILSGSFKDGL